MQATECDSRQSRTAPEEFTPNRHGPRQSSEGLPLRGLGCEARARRAAALCIRPLQHAATRAAVGNTASRDVFIDQGLFNHMYTVRPSGERNSTIVRAQPGAQSLTGQPPTQQNTHFSQYCEPPFEPATLPCLSRCPEAGCLVKKSATYDARQKIPVLGQGVEL